MRNTARLFVVQLGFVALIEPLVSALTIAELVLGYLCDGSAPRRARTSHVDSFQGLLDLNLRVGRAAHGDAACDLRPPPTRYAALSSEISLELSSDISQMKEARGRTLKRPPASRGKFPRNVRRRPAAVVRL